MSATVTEKHRGLAKELWSRIATSLRQPKKGPDIVAQAIADAEERGRIAGTEQCIRRMKNEGYRVPLCVLALLPSEEEAE